MKIITFGSCLSRNTADHYRLIFGGEIVSCVYHNRSDQFLSYHVDKTVTPIPYELLEKSLTIASGDSNAPDGDPLNILRNQYSQWIGRHRLQQERSFFDVIENDEVDLIILDNYMDVAAKLRYAAMPGVDERSSVFLRPADFASGQENFTIGDYISAEDSAANWHRIIDFIKERQPKARLAFLHFPYNTYVNDQARQLRSIGFQKAFATDKCYTVPPLFIRMGLRTEVASHFKPAQYAAYAGMIRVSAH